ncbi:hypothetical protein AVEN_150285-1 [Araneus ventricosus]|uniref:Uncharacterized protein n=1 Tax=Araneus ventricosus TaxID=182803 RepID=A0A4Y2J2H9_ARAVE|nr:hypothetical protein AVEN_150285-1 [Araneus ventricosus]
MSGPPLTAGNRYFQTQSVTDTQDNKTNWKDESEIKIFVKETLPTPNEAMNDVKESFTLLLLMLYFQAQYKSSVALQYKMKRFAHSAAQIFIKELNDLKQQPNEITQTT